nr:hypothetical protein Iba_chr04bCG15070 [Ipomoea batatas]
MEGTAGLHRLFCFSLPTGRRGSVHALRYVTGENKEGEGIPHGVAASLPELVGRSDPLSEKGRRPEVMKLFRSCRSTQEVAPSPFAELPRSAELPHFQPLAAAIPHAVHRPCRNQRRSSMLFYFAGAAAGHQGRGRGSRRRREPSSLLLGAFRWLVVRER